MDMLLRERGSVESEQIWTFRSAIMMTQTINHKPFICDEKLDQTTRMKCHPNNKFEEDYELNWLAFEKTIFIREIRQNQHLFLWILLEIAARNSFKNISFEIATKIFCFLDVCFFLAEIHLLGFLMQRKLF